MYCVALLFLGVNISSCCNTAAERNGGGGGKQFFKTKRTFERTRDSRDCPRREPRWTRTERRIGCGGGGGVGRRWTKTAAPRTCPSGRTAGGGARRKVACGTGSGAAGLAERKRNHCRCGKNRTPWCLFPTTRFVHCRTMAFCCT